MHVAVYVMGCFMIIHYYCILQMFGKDMKEYQSAKDIMTAEATKVCYISKILVVVKKCIAICVYSMYVAMYVYITSYVAI